MAMLSNYLRPRDSTDEVCPRSHHAGEANRDGRQHGGAGRLVAGHARSGRSAAACARRRDRPAAGGPGRQLAAAGFDASRPAVVASTGVTMYLTRDAIAATLRQVATLAPGSTLAMTFMLPLELVEPEERPQYQAVQKSARAAGTPFLSFFSPREMLALARDAGFT